MAKGENADKQRCKDWWGKRPLSGTSVSHKGMKFWKRLLHKIERKQNERKCREEL